MTPATDRLTGNLIPALATLGFATAAVMWVVGFLTHLPGLGVPPVLIGGVLLAVQFLGGVVAGRLVGPGAAKRVGLGTGVVSAAINLLIVGSVVSAESGANELRPGWVGVVFGSIGFGAVLGMVGAIVGAGMATRRGGVVEDEGAGSARDWLGRFGLVAAVGAAPVLLSGGLVTSSGSGLAVPDWPTSYGANMFLFPLSKMTGGIYYEHSHRLFGSLAGLTTLALLVFILIAERRAWMKGLGVAAFVFVCGQGLLGWRRIAAATAASGAMSPESLVDNKGSLVLAMVHGITGQLFFAMLCAMAAMLGGRWLARDDAARPRERGLRALALALLGALVVQLGMGSAARHLNQAHALWTHVGFAVVVIALAALTGFRASGRCKDVVPVRRLGKAVVHTVGFQAVLGLATLLTVLPYQPGKVDSPTAVVLATAHQAVGAALIGCAAALAVWALRLGTRGALGASSAAMREDSH